MNTCQWKGCEVEVQENHWGCWPHWSKLPRSARKELLQHFAQTGTHKPYSDIAPRVLKVENSARPTGARYPVNYNPNLGEKLGPAWQAIATRVQGAPTPWRALQLEGMVAGVALRTSDNLIGNAVRWGYLHESKHRLKDERLVWQAPGVERGDWD